MAPPQFSDDRKWWWDGTKWVPADQTQAQPEGTPSAPMATAGLPQPASSLGLRARTGSVPTWVAVLGLLVCFPIGIVLALLTAWPTKAKAITIGGVVAFVF